MPEPSSQNLEDSTDSAQRPKHQSYEHQPSKHAASRRNAPGKQVPKQISLGESESVAAGFPALLVEAEKLAHTMMNGLHGRKRAGAGETFWQHRPYTFGDSVSQIDWRQSARADDRLYIRQNEWEAAASVWLWRDPTDSMVYSSNVEGVQKRTRATILATAISILLSQSGERVGVLGHEGRFYNQSRLFSGRGAPSRILESLDHSMSTQPLDIPLNHGVKAGSQLVFLSDFFMEPTQLAKAIDYYSRQGVRGVLCQVLDIAEQEFPFKGRTEFLDTESSDRLMFGNARSLKQTYQEKFNQHQTDLTTISKKSGWPLITHYTQKPAQNALMFLHQALSEKKMGAM